MYDMQVLERHGVSSKAYKAIFSLDPAEYPRQVKKLVDQIRSEIKDGRTLNLTEWRAYAAIDQACKVPFSQTTPTIVNAILSRNLTFEQTQKELANWGLSEKEIFQQVQLPDGNVGWLPNPPVFFQIFIPIVLAYLNVRCAHLFNQLNVDPLLEYLPLKETARNRLICEVLTDLVDTQTTWYGYPATLRQAIMQMLKYGTMLAFPLEEWHVEKQIHDVSDGFGGTREHAVIVREGLRYSIPHPTRMGYDLNFPLTTLNTDTGTTFAFFWRVMTYGEVLDNPLYWNRKSIFAGTNWFQAPLVGNYFTEIYPCQINFPVPYTADPAILRDDKASWYQSDDRDQSVFVTEFFKKIIPKQYGLGDYKYPVWHRFTVAGDDTIIWAAPCAYTPAWFMGYDYDENAAQNSSMGLELIPWQDHLGNLLSQMILTAKQNLAKVVFYDTNIVDKRDIDTLKNMGEMRYRSTQYIGYDSLKVRVAGLTQAAAFQVPNLGQFSNVTEMIQVFPYVLQMLERVLQISAQEAGSQATHQQSKEEVLRTGTASTNRVTYIMSSVLEGKDAWMRQLYEGNMAYRDTGFAAQVSADIPQLNEVLSQLGFTVEDANKEKVFVAGRKNNLRLEGFARTCEGADKQPDAAVAQTIFQLVQSLSQNQELAGRIGPKNLLSMLNLAATLAGAPRGFKIEESPEGEAGQQVQPNVLQAITASQEATMQAISEKIAKPAAQKIGDMEQQLGQLQQVVQELQKIYDSAQQIVNRDAVKARESAVKQEIASAEHQAEMQRKIEQHNLDMAIEEEKASLEMDVESAKAANEISVKRKTAAADVAIAAKTSAAKSDRDKAE